MSLPRWRRWLGPVNRSVVPFTPFSEYETGPGGKRSPVWFALSEGRPSDRSARSASASSRIFASLAYPPRACSQRNRTPATDARAGVFVGHRADHEPRRRPFQRNRPNPRIPTSIRYAAKIQFSF